MFGKSVGFVGGGRAVRFILCGLKRAGKLPARVVVSDVDAEALRRLLANVPSVETVVGDNTRPAEQDLVFIAVHPAAVGGVLSEIKAHLRQDSVLVSLAPKVRMANISEALGGFRRIVRMIPNAPAIVNSGYNPVCYSEALDERDKLGLSELFGALGECPEVAEEGLEAYAVLTAMGPTYFWFQIDELQKLGESFGLSAEEVGRALQKTVEGAVRAMYESGLRPEEVMDLIPVKPLADHEESIREAYRSKLSSAFARLKQ